MQWVFTVMALNSYKWDYNSCRLRLCIIILQVYKRVTTVKGYKSYYKHEIPTFFDG